MLSCFSRPTLRDPIDCSLPGSSAHRILQARILEWVAIFSSGGSSRSRDADLPHWQADSLPLESSGKSPLSLSICQICQRKCLDAFNF